MNRIKMAVMQTSEVGAILAKVCAGVRNFEWRERFWKLCKFYLGMSVVRYKKYHGVFASYFNVRILIAEFLLFDL
jgi:hypothetical protein